jgi:hypothetical protein
MDHRSEIDPEKVQSVRLVFANSLRCLSRNCARGIRQAKPLTRELIGRDRHTAKGARQRATVSPFQALEWLEPHPAFHDRSRFASAAP